LTLRHGNRCIVATNKISQNNKKDTGGLRVAAGEDHILFNNLIENVNNTGITLNNGKDAGIYNKPVVNVNVNKNINLNCGTDYIVGKSTKDFNKPPANCLYKDNIAYKTTKNPVFSSVKATNKYENNKYYAVNFGSNPPNAGTLSKPSEFNPSTINKNLYVKILNCLIINS
jgi:poly(beta-D-mannuronate) lyase